MTQIIGIAGSLRTGSYNAALLRAAAELTPQGATIEVASIAEIPLYNGDTEQRDGIPAPVEALKEQVADADGLLLASPEYNNSIPGVMKNAIDWLSRPPADQARVFHNKAVALMGASRGPKGTTLAQAAWLPVFRAFKMRPCWAHTLYVGGAQNLFDESGQLTDESLESQLRTFMADFVQFIG